MDLNISNEGNYTDEFPPADGELTPHDLYVQSSLESICCVLLLIILIVYVVDLFKHGYTALQKISRQTPGAIEFHKPANVIEWIQLVLYKVKKRVIHPTPLTLTRFTLANCITTVLYIFFTQMSDYLQNGADADPALFLPFGSLSTLTFMIAKFCLSGFYIDRYQLTASELQQFRPAVVMWLWFLNVCGAVCTFLPGLSWPPYINVVDEEIAYAVVILYPVLDAILNFILLFMLVKPISEHVNNLKLQIQNNSASENKKTKEEHKRIRKFQRIIWRTIFTCACSVVITVVANVIYAKAFYTDAYYDVDQLGNHTWYTCYIVLMCIEAVSCSLLPLANYPRFKVMWPKVSRNSSSKDDGTGIIVPMPMPLQKKQENSKADGDVGKDTNSEFELDSPREKCNISTGQSIALDPVIVASSSLHNI
jgi:hypothetical protein